jgi:AcrR family transcriptional regulator
MASRSTATPPKALRRDAQRNRDTIVAVARAAFAEQGLDASFEGIARQAGIAIGTLYRHFPTRLALVETLFTEKYSEWVAAGEKAVAMNDAWQAFSYYLEKFCQLQAGDRAFNDLTSVRLPTDAVFTGVHQRALELAHQIFDNAQRQGVLRDDVTTEDLAFVIWSQAGIIRATRTAAPDAWRRYLHLMLDAFRADRAHELPEPPMTPGQVEESLMDIGGLCQE